jgi:predicted Zn-dependent peptidase
MLDSYLTNHYRGPDMVLAAAGAIDHDALVTLAGDKLGAFAAKPGSAPAKAVYRGGELTESRDHLQETQVMIGFEGRPHTAESFYTAQVLAAIIGGGMSSRLFQEVREKRGLCYSIYAFHWSFADTGLFGVHAATGPDDVARLMPVVVGELERAAHDINEKELDRARAQLRAGLLMTLESPAARAGQIARQMLLFGRTIPVEELVARINAIGVNDVRRLAGDIFTGSPPVVTAIGGLSGMMGLEKIADRFGATVGA